MYPAFVLLCSVQTAYCKQAVLTLLCDKQIASMHFFKMSG